jgi:isopenicillin N synthase-like dioxygenase
LPLIVTSEWVKVKSEGGLVVNAGDLWVDWTGGRWKSGLHRVVNPSSDEAKGTARLSVPFFTGPKPDTLIFDVFGGEEQEGVMAGEHLRRKLERSNS